MWKNKFFYKIFLWLGNNIIDGRFISKRAAVFIDIIGYTQLGKDSPYEGIFLSEITSEINQIISNGEERFEVYSDKVNHLIHHNILFPLQRANWSAIPTWIPQDPIKRLHLVYGAKCTNVYGKHMYNWNTHRWELVITKLPTNASAGSAWDSNNVDAASDSRNEGFI